MSRPVHWRLQLFIVHAHAAELRDGITLPSVKYIRVVLYRALDQALK